MQLLHFCTQLVDRTDSRMRLGGRVGLMLSVKRAQPM